MAEQPARRFRVEWHSYQGGSTVVKACSRAEAVEKEKQSPFSGTDFEMHEELDNIFVVPRGTHPPRFLNPTPKREPTGLEAEDGYIRKYVVSATYRKIYESYIFAVTPEEAQRQARENPKLKAGWKLVNEFEYIVAELLPEGK
ncbi:MAG TPA: hypothetical protein VFL97_02055 [Nitrococcus sp.]|nr:hypothetical protein [Nitrococcus sp.]